MRGANYCGEYVYYLSVCLSGHSHNSKTTRHNFIKFLFVLPVVLIWSSAGRIAILYVLLVLWMTSGFHTWSQWTSIKHGVMFRRNSPGGSTSWTLRQQQCLVEFMMRLWHQGQSLPCTNNLFMLQCGRYSMSSDGATSTLQVKKARVCDSGSVGVFVKNCHDVECVTTLNVYSITSPEDLRAALRQTSKTQ